MKGIPRDLHEDEGLVYGFLRFCKPVFDNIFVSEEFCMQFWYNWIAELSGLDASTDAVYHSSLNCYIREEFICKAASV